MRGRQVLDSSYRPYADELITLPAAAELSGHTPTHLGLLARHDELWAIKIGRDWLTTEAAVQAYLAREIKPGRKTT